jgi:hypothetical protein
VKTPIAFFLFRRPETTELVFQSIRRARPETLFLIADGPRAQVSGEIQLCNQTRDVVKEIDWPCQVFRIYSEYNLGLRERILSGLDEVFSVVDRAIILEDDCLPNTSFFTFCEDLLKKYENSTEIALVSGFNFAPTKNSKFDYYFSKSASIWGWATWAKKWKTFRTSPQVESWSKFELQEISKTFHSILQRRDFIALAKIAGTLNTWDVSVAVWVRQNKLLTVVPFTNLVSNIGFGEQATHTKFEAFDVQIPTENLGGAVRHPEQISYHRKHEVWAWRRKSLRWITFPISHPFEFISRLRKFFVSKPQTLGGREPIVFYNARITKTKAWISKALRKR